MNMVVIATMFIHSAFASTHFVAQSIITSMYLFPMCFHASSIGPMKFEPHFMNGFFGNEVTIFAKLIIFRPPTC